MKRIRYARLMIVVMLAAFFTSVILQEIITKLVSWHDIYESVLNQNVSGLVWLRDVCGTVWFSILIGLCVYHALIGKMRILAGIFAALCIVVVVGAGVRQLLVRNEMLQVAQILQRPSLIHITKIDMGIVHNKVLMNKYSDLSYKEAKYNFIQAGVIGTYFDNDGTKKPYIPSQTDIMDRHRMQQSIKLFTEIHGWLLLRVWLYSIAAIIAVIVAVICFIVQRQVIQNTTVNQAAK